MTLLQTTAATVRRAKEAFIQSRNAYNADSTLSAALIANQDTLKRVLGSAIVALSDAKEQGVEDYSAKLNDDLLNCSEGGDINLIKIEDEEKTEEEKRAEAQASNTNNNGQEMKIANSDSNIQQRYDDKKVAPEANLLAGTPLTLTFTEEQKTATLTLQYIDIEIPETQPHTVKDRNGRDIEIKVGIPSKLMDEDVKVVGLDVEDQAELTSMLPPTPNATNINNWNSLSPEQRGAITVQYNLCVIQVGRFAASLAELYLRKKAIEVTLSEKKAVTQDNKDVCAVRSELDAIHSSLVHARYQYEIVSGSLPANQARSAYLFDLFQQRCPIPTVILNKIGHVVVIEQKAAVVEVKAAVVTDAKEPARLAAEQQYKTDKHMALTFSTTEADYWQHTTAYYQNKIAATGIDFKVVQTDQQNPKWQLQTTDGKEVTDKYQQARCLDFEAKRQEADYMRKSISQGATFSLANKTVALQNIFLVQAQAYQAEAEAYRNKYFRLQGQQEELKDANGLTINRDNKSVMIDKFEAKDMGLDKDSIIAKNLMLALSNRQTLNEANIGALSSAAIMKLIRAGFEDNDTKNMYNQAFIKLFEGRNVYSRVYQEQGLQGVYNHLQSLDFIAETKVQPGLDNIIADIEKGIKSTSVAGYLNGTYLRGEDEKGKSLNGVQRDDKAWTLATNSPSQKFQAWLESDEFQNSKEIQAMLSDIKKTNAQWKPIKVVNGQPVLDLGVAQDSTEGYLTAARLILSKMPQPYQSNDISLTDQILTVVLNRTLIYRTQLQHLRNIRQMLQGMQLGTVETTTQSYFNILEKLELDFQGLNRTVMTNSFSYYKNQSQEAQTEFEPLVKMNNNAKYKIDAAEGTYARAGKTLGNFGEKLHKTRNNFATWVKDFGKEVALSSQATNNGSFVIELQAPVQQQPTPKPNGITQGSILGALGGPNGRQHGQFYTIAELKGKHDNLVEAAGVIYKSLQRYWYARLGIHFANSSKGWQQIEAFVTGKETTFCGIRQEDFNEKTFLAVMTGEQKVFANGSTRGSKATKNIEMDAHKLFHCIQVLRAAHNAAYKTSLQNVITAGTVVPRQHPNFEALSLTADAAQKSQIAQDGRFHDKVCAKLLAFVATTAMLEMVELGTRQLQTLDFGKGQEGPQASIASQPTVMVNA
jgi:hypothetical protein